MLPKVAQDLLMNMSIGSVDMSVPNMYHYLPHLIGKPGALKPAIKLSKGRAGGWLYKRIVRFCSCMLTCGLLCILIVSEIMIETTTEVGGVAS